MAVPNDPRILQSDPAEGTKAADTEAIEIPSDAASELFHVSTELYKPGTVIGPHPLTRFIERRLGDANYARVEDDFEAARPDTSVSRHEAVFAFGSPAECRRFWEAELALGARPQDHVAPPHYYRVTMPAPIRLPIKLVDHALRRLLKSLPDRPVIDEYWAPRQEWQCWEYLDRTLRVEEHLTDEPDPGTVWIFRGTEDGTLARTVWPLDPTGA